MYVRSIILLVAALWLSVSVAYGQSVNGSVSFDDKIHDFGPVEETGGKVTHRFTFTNVGRDTVTMLRARAGCSCVHAEVSKRPVYPGQKGYVDVTFDPDYRPGHFSKEIAVFSAGNKYNRIWVKGDVIPGKHPVTEACPYDFGEGLYMNYKVLNFGALEPWGTVSMPVRIGNDTDTPINVAFKVENPSAELTVIVPAPCEIGARDQIEVRFALRGFARFDGKRTARIIPVVDGKKLKPLELSVYSPASE